MNWFLCECKNGLLMGQFKINDTEAVARRCSIKECVLKNFTPATLLKKDSSTGVFFVNFAKFLKTPFLQNTSGRLPQSIGTLRNGRRCRGRLLEISATS